jgi:DNA modification methylase
MAKTYLTDEQIDIIKNNESNFFNYINNQNEGSIIYFLEKIGKLQNGISKEPLLYLLKSSNENIRALALKNLAKLSDINLVNIFLHYAQNDTSTFVRREAVSAIGRLRNSKAITYLIKLLNDSDPKVIMQAIRGLLVFSNYEEVKFNLKKLEKHPNEQIQEIIQKEFQEVEKTNTKYKHDEHPSFLNNVVVNADVIDTLKNVPEDSIHLTFTSPPYYNARDYSIYQSYNEYLNFLNEVFIEVHRVTKEGRYFILNTSPIIIPRVSRSHSSKRYPIPFDIHPYLIKMGWEFIDDIIWVKPEASVKNRNAGFLQHRKPLAYKPNSLTEMIMVYRKKTTKLLDWNIDQYNWERIKKSKVNEDYETTNIWKIDPTFDKIHSAVFPIELCNRIIKYYSMIDDLVFDPFAGCGTLAKAAILLKRNFFLTEIDKKYFNRIKEVLGFKYNSFFTENSIRYFNLDEFIYEVNLNNQNYISQNNYGIVSDSILKTKKKKNDTNKSSRQKHNKKVITRK